MGEHAAFQFIQREVFTLGAEVQLVVEWTGNETWLTVISREVLPDRPLVIGPVPVRVAEAEALAGLLAAIAARLRRLSGLKKGGKATK